MNIFKNKYFLLGNLAFLLLVIPVVLFFVKNQTSTRGSAAPTTTLSFGPQASLTMTQCDASKSTNLILNPGQNIVSTVQLELKWDKSKFDLVFDPNTTVFPQTLKGPTQTSTGMTITLNIGADVTKAISTITTVGALTIKPLAPNNGTAINLTIDPVGTKVYSLSQQDGVTENVYNASGSLALPISISAQVCSGTSPSPTVTSSIAPTVTSAVTPTVTSAVATPTPTTVVAANQPPVCLTLGTSTSSGSAPLSVTLTGTGKDGNGTIAKATFNFGDGTSQNVTSGLGTASVSAQLSHTYNSGGTFNATVNFTDNSGAASNLCSQPIVVSGAVATLAPTATATLAPIAATDTPQPTATIAPSGSISATFGLIGGIILAIAAGIFLLAL